MSELNPIPENYQLPPLSEKTTAKFDKLNITILPENERSQSTKLLQDTGARGILAAGLQAMMYESMTPSSPAEAGVLIMQKQSAKGLLNTLRVMHPGSIENGKKASLALGNHIMRNARNIPGCLEVLTEPEVFNDLFPVRSN